MGEERISNDESKGGKVEAGGGEHGGRTHATPGHSFDSSDAKLWKMWPLIPRNNTQHSFQNLLNVTI